MDSDCLFQVDGLSVSFFTAGGEVKAVRDVSFSLGCGEGLGIVGESGGGKSALACALTGLLGGSGLITAGRVFFRGRRLDNLPERELRKIRGGEISMVFQDPAASLNPVYPVGKQLAEVLALHTDLTIKERKARAAELLDLVGISEADRRMKQYPYELSGGMRQRVLLAEALACGPSLLIADEPTAALDATVQAQILDLLTDFKSEGRMAMLLITHDISAAFSICDRIAVMYAGKIVESGSVDDIFFRPRHCYTQGLLRSAAGICGEERLVPIEGTPVDPMHLPKGCPFAPRCPVRMRVCWNRMPEETEISPGHRCACWMLQKEAVWAEKTIEPDGNKGLL